jgi:hypothetical protein
MRGWIMTGARSHFIQSTAFLPLPQLILIPVGLASIVSYFMERRAVVAEQARAATRTGPQLVTREKMRPRQRRTLGVVLATALTVLAVVGASLYTQFRREQILAAEMRALEPYPGVIVMDTEFEHPWLLSNKSAVRSEYSTTAGFLAITEYYQKTFEKGGWNSAASVDGMRELKYCKGPYAARLEYPEQELDPGYRYAVEIRVDDCS